MQRHGFRVYQQSSFFTSSAVLWYFLAEIFALVHGVMNKSGGDSWVCLHRHCKAPCANLQSSALCSNLAISETRYLGDLYFACCKSGTDESA